MEGDSCKVYSTSQGKWLSGKITKQLKIEGWVTVEYGDGNEKDLNINDKEHIKLLSAKGAKAKSSKTKPKEAKKRSKAKEAKGSTKTKASESSSKIKVGAQCEVFSRSQNKWKKGEVIQQLDASHVRVKYGGGGERNIKIDDKNFRLSASKTSGGSSAPTKNILKGPSSTKSSLNMSSGQVEVGDQCEIFSQSQNKWMKGKITKKLDRNHIRVEYGDGMEKDIEIGDEKLRLSATQKSVDTVGRRQREKVPPMRPDELCRLITYLPFLEHLARSSGKPIPLNGGLAQNQWDAVKARIIGGAARSSALGEGPAESSSETKHLLEGLQPPPKETMFEILTRYIHSSLVFVAVKGCDSVHLMLRNVFSE